MQDMAKINTMINDAPIEFMDLPIFACEVNQTGKLLWANKLFREEFLSNSKPIDSIFRLIPQGVATSKSLKGKKKFSIKSTIKSSNGRLNVLEFCFIPSPATNATNYTVVINNLTQLEREIKVKNLLINLIKAEQNSKDLNSFYSSIQHELNSLMDATNLFIVLWDKLHQNLKLTYFNDERDRFEILPLGKTLSSFVLEQGKPMLLTENDILRLQYQGAVDIIGTLSKAWMGVILKNNQETIGLLAVQSYKSEKAYTNDDLKVLEFVSNQIAISIERKQYEYNLKMAKERAEESDKLKSAFLANMSHEIRTPMNSIIGFSELITRKTISPEKKDAYANYITNSSKSLLALIDDIIDISKIEAKQMKVSKASTNVNKMMDELFDYYDSSIDRNSQPNLKIKKHIAIEDYNFHILCDYNKVRQILNNLMNNATKFTKEGHVELGYILPNNATILFYVEDTGIGIESNKLDLIFEPFRQADDSTTRKYGGTGLGLAISKRLAQLMGGRIWVDSEPNKGTTFFFSLPLIIPSTSVTSITTTHERKPMHNLKGKTILVAEDEDINYMFLQEVLSPTNAKVLRACNGQEAVNLVKNNPSISLVLMDIQMPVLNGYEATRQIKAMNPRLPVIAQTAYAMAEDRAKGIRAGCDDYLSKPIKPNQLIDIVKQYLGNKVLNQKLGGQSNRHSL
jgi:signal transduction histidine kinase/CheY-like chemotaxis protein